MYINKKGRAWKWGCSSSPACVSGS